MYENENDNISDEFEDEFSFKASLYKTISPKVKKFISWYFGEQFLNLNTVSYSDIEDLIKNDIYLYSDEIPDILFRHRTIKDDDLFYDCLNNFVSIKAPIKWHVTVNWFERNFKDNDEKDTFIEDSYPIDLTDDQKKTKQIINIADEITDNTQKFAVFLNSAYKTFNSETHLFLENNAIFDLSILSADGFIELQEHIDLFITTLFEDLYELIMSDE